MSVTVTAPVPADTNANQKSGRKRGRLALRVEPTSSGIQLGRCPVVAQQPRAAQVAYRPAPKRAEIVVARPESPPPEFIGRVEQDLARPD